MKTIKLLSITLIALLCFASCETEEATFEVDEVLKTMPTPLEVGKNGLFIHIDSNVAKSVWDFQCGNSATGEQIHMANPLGNDPQWIIWREQDNGVWAWEGISGINANSWCNENDPYFSDAKIKIEKDYIISLIKNENLRNNPELSPVDILCSSANFAQVIWEDSNGDYHYTYQDSNGAYHTEDLRHWRKPCAVIEAGGFLAS